MKTEAEARKCWCPFAGEQRRDRQDEYCIASECMAWLWEDDFDPSNLDPDEKAETLGFCGLAGKP